MSKLIRLTLLVLALFSSLPNLAYGNDKPIINFSDLTAAPATGWSTAQPMRGAVVTIWGRNFGSSRANSYVSINGRALTNDSDYAETWGESAKPVPFLQRVSFWLNSSVPSGPGEITITINGQPSDPIPFRVGVGNIYFVDVNVSGNGSGSLLDPWQDLADFIDVMQAGDIAYFREGRYDQRYNGGKSNIWVRSSEPSGTATQPIAFVAYPGERAVFDSITNGTGSNFNRSISIDAAYITISKFIVEGYAGGINAGPYTRVVGNDAIGLQTYLSGTGIITTDNDGAKIFGNTTHGGRTANRLDHAIYLSGCAPVEGAEVAYNYAYDNSIDRGPQFVVNHQGDRCSSGQVLKSHSFHHNLIDCSDYPSRAIGVFDQSLDVGETEPEPTFIYNNIIKSCGGPNGAPVMYHNNGHAVFYNNTLVDSRGPGLNISGSLRLSTIAVNNVFHQRDANQEYVSDPLTLEDSNLYFGGKNSSISATATNTVLADPQVTIDLDHFAFSLAKSSPAIGQGSNSVSTIVMDDFLSKRRHANSGFDIGALQFGGSNPVVIPPILMLLDEGESSNQ